jgi:hypothetical protein
MGYLSLSFKLQDLDLYNVPIEDKNGSKSLFLPRFIEVRSDKTEPENLVTRFNKKK